jgi:hypothetical protein
MNENYLWNKSGEDQEIEKLENSLKSLRYRETVAPLIPVKTAAEEKKSSFRLFPFLVPTFACLAIVLFALSFWVKDSINSSDEFAKNEIETQITVQKNDGSENISPVSDIKQTVKYEEKSGARRRLNRLPKARPAYVRVNSATAQKNAKKNSTDVLTKEEKYAYDQLMTALAITNSQFRLVREKIKGIENQTADANGGR